MKITRDVITDLLPVYLAGEASVDTRTLVEDFFRQDPEFEQLTLQSQTSLHALEVNDQRVNPEKETLTRVKQILRVRSILFGIALFCSVMPFAFGQFDGGPLWFMARDMPAMAAGFAVSAILAWITYAWTFRALRDNK